MIPWVITMTTEQMWTAFELVELVDAAKRYETLEAITGRLVPALHQIGSQSAVAVYWTSAALRDSPLARAKGFWKSWREVAATVPTSALLSEERVHCGDAIHFLASAAVPLSKMGLLNSSVLRYERNRACVLVPLTDGASTTSVLGTRDVLARSRCELDVVQELGPEASRSNVVVIVPFGRFDDCECGMFLYGPAALEGMVPGLHRVGP